MSTDLFSPSNEHALLRASVSEFIKATVEPGATKRDREEFFDASLFRQLGSMGLLGITVPEEFGGSGMDAVSAVIAHEEMASSDPGLTLAYLAHSMLCVNNIAQNADLNQKQNYLPKLCSGEWIGAMAMSESQAGTDVLSMKTKAVKSKEAYVIDGQKMWITNGALDNTGKPADVVFLYARTPIGDTSRISSFIVEAGDEGYGAGQIIKDKCGMRASITAELIFTNCRLPENRLVGKEGDALLHMMRNLELERLTLAAISLGIAKRSLRVMLDYASQREAFGKKLSYFGQIQSHIANSYAEYQAARSYVYRVAGALDLTKPGNRVDSDGVKLFTAKVAKNIADRAIQTLGGNGYVGEYHVERLWRDAKLLEIGGGTNEAHEKNMTKDLVRSQGLL